ncbi:FkbM family methyltransferase [Ruegeria atlantica]|uniref:FkbM family methyltransferase n=1 Tax=Ruegeria atlantica TaxID=81569 RepID=UPI00147B376D|nr:FkbM family methyltransferase [Ruegeria atlantica]
MGDNKKSGLSRAARRIREAGRVLRGKKKPVKLTFLERLAKESSFGRYQYPAADQGIIVDIGMNDGKDTVYYRKRGFQVIAIEAIPHLCTAVAKYFADSQVDGVDIRNFAVTDDDADEVTFYVNKFNTAWSSVDEEFGSRRDGAEKIVVPAIDLSKDLRPVSKKIHYLKIDIEGLDQLALSQIMALPHLPPYVSVENGSLKMLEIMHEHGYDRFKFSNQKYVEYQTFAPSSPHGHIPEHTFEISASGAFGEDVPGNWIRYEDAVKIQKL